MEDKVNKLAAWLYESYCKDVGGISYDGNPLPRWREFRADPKKQIQSDAWYAMATRIDEKTSLASGF